MLALRELQFLINLPVKRPCEVERDGGTAFCPESDVGLTP